MLQAPPTAASSGVSTPRPRSTDPVPSAIAQSLARLGTFVDTWRARALPEVPSAGPVLPRERWLVAVPDVGPACEVLLADQLFHDLDAAEREGLLHFIRASQDDSGAWLDIHGRPDLSLTALAYWARAQAGDDRRSESMVKAV